MYKCTNQCRIAVDSRTKEEECFVHGTVTFVRQSHDKLDTSDLDEINGSTVNEYSDEYIYHVLKGSTPQLTEICRELNLHHSTLWRKARRHMIKNHIPVDSLHRIVI